MIVGVPKETFPGERRVALAPAVVPSLTKAKLEVVVQAGAGAEAGYPDADYAAKGAKILPTRPEIFSAADIIIQVLPYGSNDRTGKEGKVPRTLVIVVRLIKLLESRQVVALQLRDR